MQVIQTYHSRNTGSECQRRRWRSCVREVEFAYKDNYILHSISRACFPNCGARVQYRSSNLLKRCQEKHHSCHIPAIHTIVSFYRKNCKIYCRLAACVPACAPAMSELSPLQFNWLVSMRKVQTFYVLSSQLKIFFSQSHLTFQVIPREVGYAISHLSERTV